jgi:hypothetical protein
LPTLDWFIVKPGISMTIFKQWLCISVVWKGESVRLSEGPKVVATPLTWALNLKGAFSVMMMTWGLSDSKCCYKTSYVTVNFA